MAYMYFMGDSREPQDIFDLIFTHPKVEGI